MSDNNEIKLGYEIIPVMHFGKCQFRVSTFVNGKQRDSRVFFTRRQAKRWAGRVLRELKKFHNEKSEWFDV